MLHGGLSVNAPNAGYALGNVKRKEGPELRRKMSHLRSVLLLPWGKKASCLIGAGGDDELSLWIPN